MLPLMWVCLVIIGGVSLFGVLYAGNTGNLWLFMVFAFINGFGGGAFYPLFAALVPDYFGENDNASNYGVVYSAKLVGGIGGGGLAAGVVVAWGYTGAYVLAGGHRPAVGGADVVAQAAGPAARRATGGRSLSGARWAGGVLKVKA